MKISPDAWGIIFDIADSDDDMVITNRDFVVMLSRVLRDNDLLDRLFGLVDLF